MTEKTAQMRCLELDRGKAIEELIRSGVEAELSWQDIARELGVARFTLRDWLRRLGAEVETKRSVRFASERQSTP